MATTWGLLYVLPDENLAATGITVATGSVDSLNPLSAVYDLLQNVPTYITPAGGVIDVVWDHGSAKQVDLVYVGPTNLPESAVIHVQRNSANTWGAPAQDIVTTIDQLRDGFSNNPYANLWFDPITGATVTGYANLQFTRIHITSAGSDPISFKEFWLGPAHQLDPNIEWGIHFIKSRATSVKKNSYGGKFKYDLGVTLNRITGLINTSAAGWAQIVEWWEAVRGEYYPFLVVPDPTVNKGYLCDWPKEFDPTVKFFEDIDIPVEFQELSRGLR